MTDVSLNGGLSLGPSRLQRRLAVLLALVTLADWLFYGHPLGVSAAVFLVALGSAATLANPVRATPQMLSRALVVFVLAVIPLVVGPSLLALTFGALGAAYLAVTLTEGARSWHARVSAAVALVLDGSWQAGADLRRAGLQWSRGEEAPLRAGTAIAWIVPLVLGGIFLLLFAAANPVIESWLAAIDLGALFTADSAGRAGFWLIASCLAWPFVFARSRAWLGARLETLQARLHAASPAIAPSSRLLGKPAILRSLLLFNALFVVQTGLDAAYLWGGVALPEGLSYAAYAHRGAYPLIVTALLAAGFVIMATRPGSEAAGSRLVRSLVYLWTGQNVLLVISSMLRLDLYVEAYALTYWRVAALIWMLLVAIGLVLIVLRIVLARSNAWLVAMNATALVLTLYLCSLVNFPAAIASYNVRHSRELSGQGVWLDAAYLVSLGPQAIPALDLYLAHRPARQRPLLLVERNALAAAHLARVEDWRAWSHRDWRLAQYLRRSGDYTGTAE